jgi:hypothetical protein
MQRAKLKNRVVAEPSTSKRCPSMRKTAVAGILAIMTSAGAILAVPVAAAYRGAAASVLGAVQANAYNDSLLAMYVTLVLFAIGFFVPLALWNMKRRQKPMG